jgi:hypothetical protein
MSNKTISTMNVWIYTTILWRIDQLLSGDSVNNKFLGNGSVNVPTATNTQATIELLLETGCFYVFPDDIL